MSEIQRLHFPFRKNGFTHEIVRREGPVLLVRRHRQGAPAHFEVVLVRTMPPNQFVSHPYEKYPSNEDWGTYGFTYPSLEHAVHGWTAAKRFDWLVAGRKESKGAIIALPPDQQKHECKNGTETHQSDEEQEQGN